MSIKISLKSNINYKETRNLVLFCDENFKINNFDKLPIKQNSNEIRKTINMHLSNKKDILLFNINSTQRLILLKIKDKFSSLDIEKKGAEFFNFIKSNLILNINFFDQNFKNYHKKNANFFYDFIQGIQLKSYEFNKYKTK